jgi:serine/threonine protein kinase/tetratricopeptide (TPR) repeat protein
MSRARSDHDLLFGILALQNGFIDQPALIAAFQRWRLDNTRTLALILQERGDLSQTQRQLLDALVDEHVRQHGGEPEKSLAAVNSATGVRDKLADLDDDDLQASLRHVRQPNPDYENPLAISNSERPDGAATLTWSTHRRIEPGDRYWIIRPHAHGGLGAVSVALDTELNREVALKQILPQHADHPESRSRFVLEAEITGGLEHPGVVPVYSLGRDAAGRPFYAMRFIRGDSLRDAVAAFHKDDGPPRNPGERLLALQKLLRRFLDVCNAIDYAHSRGVLHRDLKPGNIMVGKYGETLVVDWGLAKVVGTPEAATEVTLRPPSASGSSDTLPGSAIGTPAFMSPEQAAGRLDKLGPASDVYSLGATLYYLLAGKVPFEGTDPGSILERVQCGDFPAPRIVKPETPRPLEAICLKAMALRPDERYRDCRALADDIERWLADEPVTAYAEPLPARVARWGRRNRPLVGTAMGILATATVGLTVGLFALSVEKNRTELARVAESQQRKRAEASEKESREKGEEAQAILGFVQDKILAAARPEAEAGGLGHDVSLRKALEVSLSSIDTIFRGRPLVEAALRSSLGHSFLVLGDAATAEQQYLLSLELYSRVLGRDHPRALRSANNLAATRYRLGRFKDAHELLEETLKLQTAKIGPEHPDTLLTMNNLANAIEKLGRQDEGTKLREQTLILRTKILGTDHADTLETTDNLASAYQAMGRYTDALILRQQVLSRRKMMLGASHSDTIKSMNNLSNLYDAVGRHEEALRLSEQTVALIKAKLGPNHPDTLSAMNNLAGGYDDVGQYQEARKLYEQTLTLRTANLGESHPDTISSMNNLAGIYEQLGRDADALKLREQTYARRKTMYGANHPATLTSMHNLANSLRDVGRFDVALKLTEDALTLRARKLGPDHPDTLATKYNLAISLDTFGRFEEALKIRREVLAQRESKLGRHHPDTLRSLQAVAKSYDDLGRREEAAITREQVLKLQKANLGVDHPDTLFSMNVLAESYLRLGQYEKALKLSRETLSLQKAKFGADHPGVLRSLDGVARSLAALDQPAEALTAIDEFLSRAPGNSLNPQVLPSVLDQRLRVLARLNDGSGCHQTAEMLEALGRNDAGSLYNAAYFRAVTAAVLERSNDTADRAERANVEADRAMAWLLKCVAAGYDTPERAAHMVRDTDLDALRDRADFRQLVGELFDRGFPEHPFAK